MNLSHLPVCNTLGYLDIDLECNQLEQLEQNLIACSQRIVKILHESPTEKSLVLLQSIQQEYNQYLNTYTTLYKDCLK